MAEKFKEKLKQANLVSKTDFCHKLVNFNRKITSNKRQYLEVQKTLNSLTTKVKIFSYVECILQAIMDLKILLFISPC